MNFKQLAVIGALLAMGVTQTGFACIGKALTENEALELNNSLVADAMTHNAISLEAVTSLTVKGAPTHYGYRGDCNGLWFSATVSFQTNDPNCTHSVTYLEKRPSTAPDGWVRISPVKSACR